MMGLDVVSCPDLATEALAKKLIAQVHRPVPMLRILGCVRSMAPSGEIGSKLVCRLLQNSLQRRFLREDGSRVGENEWGADVWRLIFAELPEWMGHWFSGKCEWRAGG
jgi:hypothetical protein